MTNLQKIIAVAATLLLLILVLVFNPFSYNPAGNRTCVTQATGHLFVEFNLGPFYSGFFSKEEEFPNQIGVQYKAEVEDLDLVDNTVDIGRSEIQFLGGATATVTGIAQFNLPNTEEEMLSIYTNHKTIESLVKRRLAPYTQECLQASAQLLTPEAHYNGGKSQMTQDYLSQLKLGSFLLEINKVTTYDSIDKVNKIDYIVRKQLDKAGQPKRKFSSILELGITVGDAQITSTKYENRIVQMLGKQIDAATAASVAKQRFTTAQQQALTIEAEGKANLVKIEYEQKQKNLVSVVAAQTQVELAQQDFEKQAIQEKAALKEASKIKILADANAYEKQRDIQANGALEQKLEAYVRVQEAWAKAATSSNWVPTYQMGNGGSSGASNVSNMVDLMTSKFARDLNLDTKTK